MSGLPEDTVTTTVEGAALYERLRTGYVIARPDTRTYTERHPDRNPEDLRDHD